MLREALAALEFDLDDVQIGHLYEHYALLKRWSSKINLTSVAGLAETVFRHFGESLAVAKAVGAGAGTVVDIGSGAGFPGVPVSVAWPDRPVVLVESSGKKTAFLKEISRGVGNLTVWSGRFEDFEGRAEWVTMRGVSPAGIAGQIGVVADRVAILASATGVSRCIDCMGLVSPETLEIPWDPRSVLVTGWGCARVSRETETS